MPRSRTGSKPGADGQCADRTRNRRPATSLRWESALLRTSASPQPALAYRALVALAVEVQQYLATPTRAPTVDPLRGAVTDLCLDEEEAWALAAALRYAGALPLPHRGAIESALASEVAGPVSRGERAPEAAATAAAAAIDDILRG